MSEKIERARKHLPLAAPAFIEPMQLRLVDALPEGDQWSYEIKWDGFRCVAIKDGHRVSLISRNGKSLRQSFPELASAFAELNANQAVIDGEIVALDESGRPAFQLLQNHRCSRCSIVFYAFDLLNLHGSDTTKLPLEERRALLGSILVNGPTVIRFSGELRAAPNVLVREAERLQLEGVVAKLRNSIYLPGKRTGSWLKLKIKQERAFVIGGYTTGIRPFESLLVGHIVDGRLIYCGKVKAGFATKTRATVVDQIRPRISKTCSFANLPQRSSGRWGDGLTSDDMKKCVWIKPFVACRVAFTEWTDGGHLRHSAFAGLFRS